MAEINITPLTDIFLVLLIIFMVSSAAMVESGAKINLPEVDSTASAAARDHGDGDPVGGDLRQQRADSVRGRRGGAAQLIAANPDVPVVLEGDREVLFGEAVQILSLAQKAGATQVAIAAEQRRN